MIVSQAILEMFHKVEGQFVSAEEMRRVLKLSASGLMEEIAELQELGYVIEVHPHLGFRLAETPNRLIAEDIKARLNPQLIGSEIIVLDHTVSTNTEIEQRASNYEGEGLVVFAESQTRGRGRRGRAWVSPHGKGLWFSVLLRPDFAPVAISRLTAAASVAVALAIRRTYSLDARIKWPNDITVNGKKLAGILTEMRGNENEISLAILGVGINVNCEPNDFPPEVANIATSLKMEIGQEMDRTEFAVHVLGALDDCYQVATEDFILIMNEWAQLSATLGKQVKIEVGDLRFEGQALALHGDGALLVRRDDGRVERVVGGDVVEER